MIFAFPCSTSTNGKLSILLGLLVSAASPVLTQSTSRRWISSSDTSFCNVSTATVDTQGGELPFPKYKVTQIGLGIGTQNYSCTSAGNYSSIGALAELYDLSCEYYKPAFWTLPGEAYRIWSAAPPYVTETDIIDILHSTGETSLSTIPAILGEHYFVPNPTGSAGLSPKWDFTSEAFAGDATAFVIAKGVGDIPSPLGHENVDLLYLTNVLGALAQEVYRTNTFGGQPPTSCTPGTGSITVKYTALYFFTGGLVRSA